ncbi:hypothetical protein [Devosia sp. RR2S18]|uniref:hypothetical protein n=1 Tax=Devosia rhizosphaerae TaxID=3049774 RepID=UPI0025414C67|nr:hypothetical protein [Devosia sp. RR2S18]WIJ25212.1 hypothetical protein QOV41_00075 [Devosia sp. RR2S18]
MLREHASGKLLVKSGSRIGGEPIVVNGYSFEEAEELCGVSYARLRRILADRDLLPPAIKKGKPVRLDKQVIDALADELRDGMTLEAAAAELGVERDAILGLMKAGLLRPLVSADRTKRLNTYTFARNTGAEFLHPLLEIGVEPGNPGDPMTPLPVAAQRARTTVGNAVAMVLDRRLAIRSIDSGAVGLQQLLVSPRELAKVLVAARTPGLTQMEAAARLGLPYNCLSDLERRGVLNVDRSGSVPFRGAKGHVVLRGQAIQAPPIL